MMAGRLRKYVGMGVLGAALVLGACGRNSDDELAQLDNQLVGNDTDPALNSALQDQILVDPTLSQQSNRNAVRPPETPVRAQYPGKAELAKDASVCGAEFEYAAAWASRLPAPFAVYPGSSLTEAAANNANGCNMRAVTFTSRDASERILGWYQSRAAAAGYSADRQNRGADQILAGVHDESGGAYFLIVTPKAGGSDVALITNNGL